MKNFNHRILAFRKWTRKGYGIYNSIHKNIKICTLCLGYLLITHPKSAKAQTDTLKINNKIDLEEVEVIGQRSPVLFSQVARIVNLMPAALIHNSPSLSVQDLLKYAPGVDVRQRGIFGVQSDINMRGGSFDHVMILLNGINITDPQTGHLSIDMPVSLESIDHIEILSGGAARIFGPNAFTGAINFVTQTYDTNNLSADILYGEHNLKHYYLSAATPTGLLNNYLTFSSSTSDGYTNNTDFSIKNLYYHGQMKFNRSKLEFQLGYNDKNFGANSFYSPKFPEQYESTSLMLSSIKYSTGTKIRLTPEIYWRRHHDHWILDRNNPSVYENYHLTDVFGSHLNASIRSKAGVTSVGMDIRSENIISNNIGYESSKPIKVKGTDSTYYDKRYNRNYVSYFAEHNIQLNKLYISAGIMADWTSDYPEKIQVFPGIDAAYQITPGIKLTGSFNRSLHLPTFTDLFYTDPSNQGNINLSPNRMISYELGAKYDRKALYSSVSFFLNDGKDIIDWLWFPADQKFSPVNLQHFQSSGIEFLLYYNFNHLPSSKAFLENLQVNYTYINVNKTATEEVSKYYNLKQKLDILLQHKIWRNLHASWNISYEERTGDYITYDATTDTQGPVPFRPFWMVDTRIYYQQKYFTLFVEASNLLNTKYVDVASLKQPGRWIKGGIKLNIGFKK